MRLRSTEQPSIVVAESQKHTHWYNKAITDTISLCTTYNMQLRLSTAPSRECALKSPTEQRLQQVTQFQSNKALVRCDAYIGSAFTDISMMCRIFFSKIAHAHTRVGIGYVHYLHIFCVESRIRHQNNPKACRENINRAARLRKKLALFAFYIAVILQARFYDKKMLQLQSILIGDLRLNGKYLKSNLIDPITSGNIAGKAK